MIRNTISAMAIATRLMLAPTALGAIDVKASQTLDSSGSTSHTNTFSFANSTDRVFLVAVTYESTEQAITTVTLDPTGSDIELTKLISSVGTRSGNSTYTAIFGVELNTVSAGNLDYVLETSSSIKNSMSAFQLSNPTLTGILTDTDDTDNSVANPLTAEFTGLDAGTFVLNSVSAKKAGITFTLGGSPSVTANGAAGGQSHHQAYSYTTDVLGNYTRTWTSDDSTDATALAAVAIQQVPEPGSLALMGLGGLLILSRYRRTVQH